MIVIKSPVRGTKTHELKLLERTGSKKSSVGQKRQYSISLPKRKLSKK